MKFKVGDRVRCIEGNNQVTAGDTYVVTSEPYTWAGDEFVDIAGYGPTWLRRFKPLTWKGGTVPPQHRSRVDAGPKWGA